MLAVNGSHLLGLIGWDGGLKTPYVKKCLTYHRYALYLSTSSPWRRTDYPDQTVSKTNLFSHVGIREPSLSHDCASKETLASKNACSNRRSCWQYMAVICWDRLVGELGLKALTSKMPVQTTFPRNLLHTYPAWLPLHLWLFFCERLQRWFTVTSVHTSFSRPAVMSRCSLWWMNGYPPVGHDSVWPMVNAFPQAQCEARYGVAQP